MSYHEIQSTLNCSGKRVQESSLNPPVPDDEWKKQIGDEMWAKCSIINAVKDDANKSKWNNLSFFSLTYLSSTLLWTILILVWNFV